MERRLRIESQEAGQRGSPVSCPALGKASDSSRHHLDVGDSDLGEPLSNDRMAIEGRLRWELWGPGRVRVLLGLCIPGEFWALELLNWGLGDGPGIRAL